MDLEVESLQPKFYNEINKALDKGFLSHAYLIETNNNSLECSDVLENQMIGLLTASDYMNASLDVNCKATTDRSCQNYNYLKLSGTEWWLVTGNSLNNYEAYIVKSSGYLDENTASGYKKVRPTIMLNNNVMIKSGSGSASNPFILK